jgi:hypothetical protein
VDFGGFEKKNLSTPIKSEGRVLKNKYILTLPSPADVGRFYRKTRKILLLYCKSFTEKFNFTQNISCLILMILRDKKATT